MNLERLHSPQPLRDADFAAIRARVRAEIAAKRTRGNAWLMLFRVAFAASLLVLLVPHVTDDVPDVPIAVKPVRIATIAPAPVVPVQPKPTTARRRKHRKPAESQLATRIEIQTADPEVRIIWIVQPTTKESS